jgi:hypothetical protein
MKKILYFIIPLCFIGSCSKKVSNETLVYHNDFETGDLANITNGAITQFNNSAVLGRYNDTSFTLSLKGLPNHDLITITFDLYIHDSWDGSRAAPDGPDIWAMLVDNSPYIYTTFSNTECLPNNTCSPQSYPLDYPNDYNPQKTGAFRTDLPGACSWVTSPHGTTQYKISKTFKHSEKTLTLKCLDKLVQTNTNDPKCDESWSVDNINVKAITL